MWQSSGTVCVSALPKVHTLTLLTSSTRLFNPPPLHLMKLYNCSAMRKIRARYSESKVSNLRHLSPTILLSFLIGGQTKMLVLSKSLLSAQRSDLGAPQTLSQRKVIKLIHFPHSDDTAHQQWAFLQGSDSINDWPQSWILKN